MGFFKDFAKGAVRVPDHKHDFKAAQTNFTWDPKKINKVCTVCGATKKA